MSKRETHEQIRRLAVFSMLSAIIIAMTWIDYIGYIHYGLFSITLIHIPVIIGAIALGPIAGIGLGSVMGVFSLLRAILMPPDPTQGLIFRNPVVSVVPRIILGLVAGLLFYWLKKTKLNSSVSTAVSAVLATLSHTILVLTMIYLFYGRSELGLSSLSLGGLTNYIIAAAGINASVEIPLAAVAAVPIEAALRKSKL